MMTFNNRIDDDNAKEIMLNILIAIDEFCEKNKITYYLAYGTLLGAIRHKGFIPWDNDVDIWMPRPDYERFRELVTISNISNDLRVLDYKNEKTFPFLKVINKNTLLKEEYLVTEKNLGLYVDVFPLDALPNNETSIKRVQDKAFLLNKLYSLSNYRFGTGSNLLIRIIKAFFYPLSVMLPTNCICSALDKLCFNNNYETSKFVGNIVWGYTYKEKMESRWFSPIKVEFEGRMFLAPIEYDRILSNIYGNYMQLPPVEKRIMHQYNAIWKD